MSRPRLSEAQRRALLRLSPRDWRGTLEVGVEGSTLQALDRKGLAKIALVKRPHRRIVGRLTDAGARLARELDLDAMEASLRVPDGWATASTDRLIALWIAGRITQADLYGELAARADRERAVERAAAVERLALDTLEQLGPDGATVRELADLLASRDLLVEDLDELERALERLGDRVRRRSSGQADRNQRVLAAIYPVRADR